MPAGAAADSGRERRTAAGAGTCEAGALSAHLSIGRGPDLVAFSLPAPFHLGKHIRHDTAGPSGGGPREPRREWRRKVGRRSVRRCPSVSSRHRRTRQRDMQERDVVPPAVLRSHHRSGQWRAWEHEPLSIGRGRVESGVVLDPAP
jgi:hypothetical protein